MLKVRIKLLRQSLVLFNKDRERIITSLNNIDGWRSRGLIKSSRDYTTMRREFERQLKLINAGIEHLEYELAICEGIG